jgi:ABC-type uncharacterized transport system ATPase subunit
MTAPRSDAPLMHASHLCKRFGGVVAVDDVSLSVSPFEVKCIIGANGAGKSTLFNMLCGSVHADSGSLEFDGQSISGLALHKFARRGIARKFQVPSVFDSLTVEENLRVAQADEGTGAANTHREEVLHRIDLIGIRRRKAGVLAHGQKQWLEIGMALMSRPRLLLLDEPTAGMTADETLKTAGLILELANQTAVVAIEHDMNFVRALQCHTLVLHQGRLIADGTFSQVESNPLVRDVYLGRA